MKNNHVEAGVRLLIGRLGQRAWFRRYAAGRISFRMVRQLGGWTSDELAPCIEMRNSLVPARNAG
ncbi:MAG TPA: hypothetical protein VGI45_10565 [Terracidiphilus sp.]